MYFIDTSSKNRLTQQKHCCLETNSSTNSIPVHVILNKLFRWNFEGINQEHCCKNYLLRGNFNFLYKGNDN